MLEFYTSPRPREMFSKMENRPALQREQDDFGNVNAEFQNWYRNANCTFRELSTVPKTAPDVPSAGPVSGLPKTWRLKSLTRSAFNVRLLDSAKRTRLMIE